MYSLILKSSENWRAKSGNVNKLNTDYLFETRNKYGFPIVESNFDTDPQDLIPFNLCTKKKAGDKNKAVHFFLDDYKFEPLWSNPKKYIELFKFYKGIISPTFSIWENQPFALNLFNVYRSRWAVAYYQYHDIPTLVDVRWADKKSYDIAFSGIKKYSPVIINTVGTKLKDNRKLFIAGFEEMIKRISPRKLYVYGEYMPVEFEKYFDEVVYFDSYWKQKRKLMKG